MIVKKMAGYSQGKPNTYFWPLVWAISLFIAYILFQGVFVSEKGRVRNFILQGKRAVESKNILSCAAMVSSEYRDKYGNDRGSLIYLTRGTFDYYERFFINIESVDIALEADKQHADVFIVALVLGQTQNNNSERILEGEKGKFRVRLIKEAKKWRLLEVEFFGPLMIMGRNIS